MWPCSTRGRFSPEISKTGRSRVRVAAACRVRSPSLRFLWRRFTATTIRSATAVSRLLRAAAISHPGGRAIRRRVQPAFFIAPTSRQKWVTPRISSRIPAYSRQSQSEPVLANLLLIGRFPRVSGTPPSRIAPRRSAVRIRLAPSAEVPARRQLRFLKPFEPPLKSAPISGTSARNRGDAKGLAAIAVGSGLQLGGGRAIRDQVARCPTKGLPKRWQTGIPNVRSYIGTSQVCCRYLISRTA
jgi:hypothetical protein